MHILLTDALSCPRCGPDFGLLVLADRLEDRQVVEGRLGCPNCREAYPIRDAVVDLRRGEPPARAGGAGEGGEERALRIAALLGVGHAPGLVVLYGASPALAEGVAALLPNARVVTASATPPPAAERRGAGWLLIGDRLPVRDGSLRALALVDGAPPELLAEAARALAPGCRIVLDPAWPGAVEALGDAGLELLLDQDGVAVASTPVRR